MSHAVEHTVDVVKHSISSAIADVLQKRNIAASPAARLPVEILVAACNYSDVETRVVASAVCQRWRQIALDAPGMWSQVDAAASQDGVTGRCSLCAKDCVIKMHNLPAVALSLQRSGTKPVDLAVVSKYRQSTTGPFFAALTKLLLPHLSRVVSLEMECLDFDLVPDFLDRFNCFPSMHSITVTVRAAFGTSYRSCMSRIIDFPRLHRLILPRNMHPFANTRSTGTLQLSLRVLACTFVSSPDILRTLTICPNLEQLHIRLYSSDNVTRQFPISSEVQAKLDRIPHVHLSNMTLAAEAWAQQHFGIACRESLQWDFMLAGPSRAFGLLQHLTGPIQLECRVAGERISATCRDQQKQIRLTFPFADNCLRELWTQLPPSALTTLDIDAAAWPTAIRHLHADTSVASLVVRINVAPDLLAILAHAGAGRFPGLGSLCLQRTRTTVFVSLASIVVFLESLGLQAPLETLLLDGIVIRTPGDALVRRVASAAGPHHDVLVPHCLRLLGA